MVLKLGSIKLFKVTASLIGQIMISLMKTLPWFHTWKEIQAIRRSNGCASHHNQWNLCGIKADVPADRKKHGSQPERIPQTCYKHSTIFCVFCQKEAPETKLPAFFSDEKTKSDSSLAPCFGFCHRVVRLCRKFGRPHRPGRGEYIHSHSASRPLRHNRPVHPGAPWSKRQSPQERQ